MVTEMGAGIALLAVGFPFLLLLFLLALGGLEDWVVRPDERAAKVQELLDQVDEADEVEVAVARLLAEVAEPRPEVPVGAPAPQTAGGDSHPPT